MTSSMNMWQTAVPIASVLLLFALRIKELRTNRGVIPGQKKETLTLRLFVSIGTLLIGCGMAEYLLMQKPLKWIFVISGIGLAILSFVVRRRAIASLGRFWSLHVEIRDHHQFVRGGPFRWMRHPAYFSMILELVAGLLVLQAWYSMWLIPVLYVPALLLRVRIEERALIEKFGDAYREYQQSTPALLPYKWPTR